MYRIKVLALVERLSAVDQLGLTKFRISKDLFTDGFNRIKAWIKTVVIFGGGTVLLGLGAVRSPADSGFPSYSTHIYKVMVHNVATNKEMKTHIKHVVEKAIPTSEQKTEAKLDNLKLSIELTTQQQISGLVREMRDEVHHYMKAKDGEN